MRSRAPDLANSADTCVFTVSTPTTDENVVHGWDLAVATGQAAEAPAGLAEPLLALMSGVMPAQRPPFVPFADAVTPRPDAGPTERLANWMGRSTPAR